jgi:hypothetical protein
VEKGGVRDGGLVCDYVASRKFQHAGAAVDVVYEVAVEEGGMRDGLPRGHLELLVAHSHIAVILTAQPYWASTHLCSLKLRYRTIRYAHESSPLIPLRPQLVSLNFLNITICY